jgi:hypothetical protein
MAVSTRLLAMTTSRAPGIVLYKGDKECVSLMFSMQNIQTRWVRASYLPHLDRDECSSGHQSKWDKFLDFSGREANRSTRQRPDGPTVAQRMDSTWEQQHAHRTSTRSHHDEVPRSVVFVVEVGGRHSGDDFHSWQHGNCLPLPI